MTYRILDLCCGLGGVREGFKDWYYQGVDINPEYGPEILGDVKNINFQGKKYNFIWSSPPCTEFTKISMPWFKHGVPDLSIVMACLKIINDVQPDYWVLENVRGSVPFITPLLGVPFRYGSRYLWGEFPLFDCDRSKCYGKTKLSPSPERAAIRGKIPLEITINLKKALEREFDD